MTLRKRVWIDRPVQGVLIGRVMLYWLCGLLYLGVGSACFEYNQRPDASMAELFGSLMSQWGPWMPSLLLVIPLVIFDVTRLSNQFAGPIYRLRQHLQQIEENPDCKPLSFRREDYWHDLAKPINSLQGELVELRKQVATLERRAQFLTGKPATIDATPTSPDTTETPSTPMPALGAIDDSGMLGNANSN